jgi:hypothetical protein
MTTYLLIYNDHKISCKINDRQMVLDFAKYMTGKERYPVAVLKIKMR